MTLGSTSDSVLITNVDTLYFSTYVCLCAVSSRLLNPQEGKVDWISKTTDSTMRSLLISIVHSDDDGWMKVPELEQNNHIS